MTTHAGSAAPTFALKFWFVGEDLLCEIPGPGPGEFTTLRYAPTASGLQSALGLVRAKAKFDGAYVNTESTKVEAAKQFLRSLGDTRV